MPLTLLFTLLVLVLGVFTCQAADIKLKNGNDCGSGYKKITTLEECRASVLVTGVSYAEYWTEVKSKKFPKGCYMRKNNKRVYFNKHSRGKASKKVKQVCVSSAGFAQGGLLMVGDSDVERWPAAFTPTSQYPSIYNVGYGTITLSLTLSLTLTLTQNLTITLTLTPTNPNPDPNPILTPVCS
jgi:hypothetical protein